LTTEDHISRELVLLKVNCTKKDRTEIMQIISTFRAKIVDVSLGHATVEVTGSEGKVDALIELLKPYGISEVVRTGLVAIGRESEVIYDGKSQEAAHVKLRRNVASRKAGKR
jgi:acetolactate synthase-1/3 small subunit